MTQQIGVAILGLGRWGVHWLRNFIANPNARVVAVADPMGANLQKVADLTTAENIYATTDWQAAIAQPGVTAIVVVTPATTHFELISTALELGLHVLAEKPLTICPKEAIALAELADRVQKILVVDHTYRFNPAVQVGYDRVQAADLGTLRYAYGTRSHLGPVRQDIDVMWDLAIHDLVILNHWLGRNPTRVSARGMSWLQNGLADTVWATLRYDRQGGDAPLSPRDGMAANPGPTPSEFEATLHWSWLNQDKQRRIGLVGSQGTLIFDELANQPLTLQQGRFDRQGSLFIPQNQTQQNLPFPTAEPLAIVCQHFLTCIAENRQSTLASGWQGAGMVEVLHALATSIRYDGASIPVESARSPAYA
jgi:predicted dehydrogenase